ncbi:MAG: M23 family metallopeptidase [Bacteroidia bacterium]
MICLKPVIRLRFLLVCILLCWSSLKGYSQQIPVFITPVDTPVHLAGTFGELRASHFHTGLDFRTGGTEGKSVCAAAGGWVSRVKVSTIGFGKVVYVDHPEGFTTVYAHLHHFSGPLDVYVDSAQQANRNYEVELFPDSGRFKFLSGELIGISGNTGGSEGPHLHFEIRKQKDQIPVNPLMYLSLEDSIVPLIEQLIIYEYKDKYYEQVKLLTLKNEAPRPAITITTKTLPDTISFGAKMNDEDPPNRLGIYEACMQADDVELFRFSFDSLNFDDGRYANAHSVLPRMNTRFHRLHRLPGNKAASFKSVGTGWLVLNDTLPHFCQITTRDFSGNADSIGFWVSLQFDTESQKGLMTSNPREFTERYKYDIANIITEKRSGAVLNIPAGALYQDMFINFLTEGSFKLTISKAVELKAKEEVPLHRAALLSLPYFPDSVKGIGKEKIILVRRDRMGKVAEVIRPDSISDKLSVSRIRNWGSYMLAIDTMSPEIVTWQTLLDSVDRKIYEVVTLKDDLSGISKVNVTVNGNWNLSVFDPRDKSLKWEIDPRAICPCESTLDVTDPAGNHAAYRLLH